MAGALPDGWTVVEPQKQGLQKQLPAGWSVKAGGKPGVPTGPGGFQVPEKGVPGPSEPPPASSPRAQAIKETITGPSAPGNTQDFFTKQREIESRLRAAGKSDAEIVNDPEWQRSAHNLSRSVSRDASGTAIGVAAADTALPAAAAAITRTVPALARIASRLAPGATGRAVEKTADIGASETPSVLGQRMHDTLTQRFARARATRRLSTDADRTAFLSQSQTTAPIIKDYTGALEQLQTTGAASLSKEERQLLQQSLAEMRGPRSLEAIEKERRRLNGLGSGQWEGASAGKQAFAKKLADQLTEIMKKHNPGFGKYLENYQQLSEPMNLYRQTLLGRAVTREGAGIPATDIAALPSKFFHTRQSVETLRKLAADEQFVDAAARVHAASQLEAKTAGKPIAGAARQARAWLEKNKDWLDAVPETRQAAEEYAGNLEAVAKTQRNAKVAAGAGVAGLLIQEGRKPYYWIRRLLGLP